MQDEIKKELSPIDKLEQSLSNLIEMSFSIYCHNKDKMASDDIKPIVSLNKIKVLFDLMACLRQKNINVRASVIVSLAIYCTDSYKFFDVKPHILRLYRDYNDQYLYLIHYLLRGDCFITDNPFQKYDADVDTEADSTTKLIISYVYATAAKNKSEQWDREYLRWLISTGHSFWAKSAFVIVYHMINGGHIPCSYSVIESINRKRNKIKPPIPFLGVETTTTDYIGKYVEGCVNFSLNVE